MRRLHGARAKAMYFRCFSYLNVLIASAMVAVVLWAYAQCHRRVRGATLFSLLMLLGAVWSLCNALEMAGTGLPTKLFWANAQYLCYTTAPVVWLVLSPQHTDCAAWLTSRRIAWLGVEPLITIALVWTNAWHGLIQRNVSLDTAGPFRVIAKAYGPWFWVHALYSGLQCIGLDTATNGAIVCQPAAHHTHSPCPGSSHPTGGSRAIAAIQSRQQSLFTPRSRSPLGPRPVTHRLSLTTIPARLCPRPSRRPTASGSIQAS